LNSSPFNYPKQTTMTTLPNTKLTFPLKLAIGTILSSCLFATTTASATQQLTSAEDLLEMDIEDLMKVKIVTIATGAKQTLAQAPAVATVITADDIEALGATDLDDVLETVPGLHVGRTIYYNPIYTLRGISSTYNPEMLVLVNGNSINILYTGGRTLIRGGMPVNAIARIEIIKGPGSALYGADAFAGVINLITKTKADIEGTEVGLRGGSFNTQDAWLLHGQTWQGFDVALAVEYHNTDGQR
jgi:iron complex outermembrane receptor protein